MGLLDRVGGLIRSATEPMGSDERHPMWSADPHAPEAPDPPDEEDGPLFGLLDRGRPRRDPHLDGFPGMDFPHGGPPESGGET